MSLSVSDGAVLDGFLATGDFSGHRNLVGQCPGPVSAAERTELFFYCFYLWQAFSSLFLGFLDFLLVPRKSFGGQFVLSSSFHLFLVGWCRRVVCGFYPFLSLLLAPCMFV